MLSLPVAHWDHWSEPATGLRPVRVSPETLLSAPPPLLQLHLTWPHRSSLHLKLKRFQQLCQWRADQCIDNIHTSQNIGWDQYSAPHFNSQRFFAHCAATRPALLLSRSHMTQQMGEQSEKTSEDNLDVLISLSCQSHTLKAVAHRPWSLVLMTLTAYWKTIVQKCCNVAPPPR